jgi:hypothetical protein
MLSEETHQKLPTGRTNAVFDRPALYAMAAAEASVSVTLVSIANRGAEAYKNRDGRCC